MHNFKLGHGLSRAGRYESHQDGSGERTAQHTETLQCNTVQRTKQWEMRIIFPRGMMGSKSQNSGKHLPAWSESRENAFLQDRETGFCGYLAETREWKEPLRQGEEIPNGRAEVTA